MKRLVNSFKYFLICLAGVGVLSVPLMSPPALAQQCQSSVDPNCDATDPDSAANNQSNCGNASLLGFPAWYNGLMQSSGDGCDIASPDKVGGIGNFIWIIAFNVVEMLLRAAGYAAVFFIIYGGYKYMTSAGSADGVAGAKKTIMNAIIGLVLSIAAIAIVNTISSGLKIGG